MNRPDWKYRLLYLIWLLPAYFTLMGLYQGLVYNGIGATYENGNEYQAIVTGFDLKQIAAQTNGFIDIRFTTTDDRVVEERLALPVQMAQVLMDYETIPVRYLSESFNPIVLVPTFDLQRNMIRVNLAVILTGLLVTGLIAWKTGQYVKRRLDSGEPNLVIERVDHA